MPRNLEIATAYAGQIVGAPAESDGRVLHLQALKAKPGRFGRRCHQRPAGQRVRGPSFAFGRHHARCQARGFGTALGPSRLDVEFRIVAKNTVVVEGDASWRREILGDSRPLGNSRMQRMEPPVFACRPAHGVREGVV